LIVLDPVNSRWWGAPVGRVTHNSLFTCDPAERERLLSSFAWAEFRAPLAAAPDPWTIAAAGFAFADAQIAFRIRLPPPMVSPSSMRLQVRFADEAPFDPGARAVRAFVHERFHLLPEATEECVSARYVTWARHLVNEHPRWCVEVRKDDVPQGWFCCQVRDGRLDLTLAALYDDAEISGLHLYEASLTGLSARGPRAGGASFSATNHDVHGIYARLGARFTSVIGFWLWRPATTLTTPTQSNSFQGRRL
jgi:hypothetical protein